MEIEQRRSHRRTDPSPPPLSGCRQSALPSLGVDQPSSIVFELGGDDRELLEPEPDTYAPRPYQTFTTPFSTLVTRAL